jgi:hypothetical protein
MSFNDNQLLNSNDRSYYEDRRVVVRAGRNTRSRRRGVVSVARCNALPVQCSDATRRAAALTDRSNSVLFRAA